jgi:FMN-dependent NADH-azoreductase
METTMNTLNILEVSPSARGKDSVSRLLSQELIDALQARDGEIVVTRRNLADSIPLLDENWVGANFTPEHERSEDQRNTLATSDALVDELRNADVLVIGVPVYNFGIPAALKAWIDMIARARVTFRYTSDGPEGLLRGKKAYLVYASGGVPVGSPADFATPYLKHVLGFVGITDTEVIAAEQLNADTPAALDRARQSIADTIHTKPARDDRAA